MSCDGYFVADFASYIIVPNTMNVQNFSNDEVPLSIAVNTDNIYAYVDTSDYCPVGGVSVPDPCDPTSTITVPCVTLTELKITGVIGYSIGIDVLDTSTNVVIEPTGVNVLSTATAFGTTMVDNEIINILDDPSSLAPALQVTVIRIEVEVIGVNDNGEHSYLVSGEFKIEPLVVV